ncbi:MAG: archaemetzincin family Zn-dependent metalloprotease [Bacteroidales bacterium]|nr:archaemetzincin family Zn-dependent metalloprotease [Bacteroidales bacterium]
MKEQSILLISHGNFEKEFLQKIASEVVQEYLFPVYIEERHIELGEFYDPMRRQYDGNRILLELDSINSPQSIKKIGLFRIDLFIPILTYIFGQATLYGSTGIASLYRLRNEQYGMKKDEELLLDRFRKVIIHELGHTFGLIHCHIPTCVMRSSTYVEDIDQKSHNLCVSCQNKI